ncbi:MAG: T9SS type A sorting domain-containing protein [Bacteroidota bacterium]
MKKALFTLLMAASPVCFHAQRVFENTNISWEHPNLSVETFKDFVFAGFTDRNPNTGLLSPTVKITDFAANPLASFYLDLAQDATLMDFVVRPATNTLLFTGYMTNSPKELFVIETDFAGNMIQANIHGENNGNEQIPHQIIVSEAMQQVIIVGTEIQGGLTPTNYTTIPKTGLVLGLDLNNQAINLFSYESDSPGAGFFDHDMLESVTEVPGVGYFMTGSANEPAGFEQNLYVMGIDYSGALMHSNIWDNTNSHYAGSSVMYSPNYNVVYLLANNSVIHQYQVTYCDPNTGAILTNMYSYTPVGFPIGGGIDVNGFRLQETVDKEIVIGGYITAWNTMYLPTLVTPFHVTLDGALTTMLDFKLYQSDNNWNSGDYYRMVGNSVYINTPDIIAYNELHDLTYMVNPNDIMKGYDLTVSHAIKKTTCIKQFPTNVLVRTPINVGGANVPYLPMYQVGWSENPNGRNWKEVVLCKHKKLDIAASGSAVGILFPNPATDQLTISLETGIRTVKLIDLNGALIQSTDLGADTRTEWTLSVVDLKAGVYIIETVDTEGTLIRERFVKE